MRTTYKAFSGRTIDVLPHVREAIALFGTVRPEAAERIASLLARHFDGGHVTQTIAATGRKLTRDQLLAAGLDPWTPVSRETLAMMTGDGAADPVAALRLVVVRASHWVVDEDHRRGRIDPDVAWLFPKVCFAVGKGPCDEAVALDGQEFQVGDEPRMPLPTCRAPFCDCDLKPLTPQRASKPRGLLARLFGRS